MDQVRNSIDQSGSFMTETSAAERGSQKWIQIGVNDCPKVLNQAIRLAASLPATTTIQWLSPLAEARYREYRDGKAFDLLGVTFSKRTLCSFWPPRGPRWDGLATTSDGEVLLVEAKAHLEEMVSSGSRAKLLKSRKLIRKSLAETRATLAPRAVSWPDSFYQFTNRLAHLYFLRALNHVPARMVFVYFIGDEDVGGPKTREEWEDAIKKTEDDLGLGQHELSAYVHHAFVTVNDLTGIY